VGASGAAIRLDLLHSLAAFPGIGPLRRPDPDMASITSNETPSPAPTLRADRFVPLINRQNLLKLLPAVFVLIDHFFFALLPLSET
jgi:hypothetical protein